MPMTRDRKNVLVLASSQALYMTGSTILVILSGLVGLDLADDKALATLPVSALMFGNAVTMFPASLLMKKIGRRPGFVLGALAGVIGAAVAAGGLFARDFALFVVGSAIIGIYAGFAQYYRFAAADAADPQFKGKAISLVVSGGIVAALAGPELAKWSSGLFAQDLYLGSYLVVAGLGFGAAILLLSLDIPRPPAAQAGDSGRPLSQIVRQPKFLVAVLVGMTGYGVTVLMMTATPLAMMAYKHGLGHTAFVIQWHTVAMFAPAFFTGALIQRLGVHTVMLAGIVLLAGCVVAALLGVSLGEFSLGLAALGVGWSFAFIGATTLLTETYTPAEQEKTQAVNDLLVFGSVGVASLLSGALLEFFDWRAVNLFAVPFLAIAGTGILWISLSARATPLPAFVDRSRRGPG